MAAEAARSKHGTGERTMSGEFKQLKVWEFVKRNPGLGSLDIAAALDITQDVAKNALGSLRLRGKVEYTGKTRASRWFVPNGATAPANMRGHHLNSRTGLRAWAVDPAKRRESRLRKAQTLRMSEGLTALEQCYGRGFGSAHSHTVDEVNSEF